MEDLSFAEIPMDVMREIVDTNSIVSCGRFAKFFLA